MLFPGFRGGEQESRDPENLRDVPLPRCFYERLTDPHAMVKDAG